MLPCGCGWAGRLFSCNGGLGWAGLELSGSHSFIFRTFVLRCGSQCYMFRGDYLDCRSCVGSRETTLVVEMPAKCKPRILMLHPSSSLSPSPCRSKTQKGAAKAKGAGKSKRKAKAKASLKKNEEEPKAFRLASNATVWCCSSHVGTCTSYCYVRYIVVACVIGVVLRPMGLQNVPRTSFQDKLLERSLAQ